MLLQKLDQCTIFRKKNKLPKLPVYANKKRDLENFAESNYFFDSRLQILFLLKLKNNVLTKNIEVIVEIEWHECCK